MIHNGPKVAGGELRDGYTFKFDEAPESKEEKKLTEGS